MKKIDVISVSNPYSPLFGLAIGLLVFSTAELLHGNPFLAAFFAGVTIASVDSDVRDVFLKFGELTSELFKLGVVLLFGALLTFNAFTEVDLLVYFFTPLVLILARPIAIFLALSGSGVIGPNGWRPVGLVRAGLRLWCMAC